MRETERFEYDGFGAGVGSAGVGSAGVGLAMAARGARARVGQQAPRRRASGPHHVRPAVVPVGVRPTPAERPACRAPSQVVPGPRVLVRRPLSPPPVVARRIRFRRAVAGVLATLVTVAVVVGLGLLADAASAARTPSPSMVAVPSEITAASDIAVTVGAGESLGDVARRAAPGVETSVVVGRIVAANSLTSIQVWPGQVLRVPVG